MPTCCRTVETIIYISYYNITHLYTVSNNQQIIVYYVGCIYTFIHKNIKNVNTINQNSVNDSIQRPHSLVYRIMKNILKMTVLIRIEAIRKISGLFVIFKVCDFMKIMKQENS